MSTVVTRYLDKCKAKITEAQEKYGLTDCFHLNLEEEVSPLSVFDDLCLDKEDPKRAAEVMQLLQWNQGNSSGNGIACVSWDGEVYADQFWRHFSFGNVKDRPFSEIWSDTSRTTPQSELMHRLKDKRPWVKGRCHDCRWLDVCGGNFRVRAEAATGDLWAPDPACYLTDEEIAKHPDDPEKRIVEEPEQETGAQD